MTKAKLERAYFEPSGGRTAKGFPDLWTVIGCSFTWDVSSSHPQLQLTIHLPRDHAQTYGGLQRQAQDHAIALLREALAQLEAHELADLDQPVEG